MQGKTLKQLAEHVGGKVIGNNEVVITAAATIETAGADEITFLANKKYIPQLATTRAGAVIVAEQVETEANLLIADDPYYAFMQIVELLHGHRKHPACGISKQASIAETAKLGENCNVAEFCVIRENTIIGKNCAVSGSSFLAIASVACIVAEFSPGLPITKQPCTNSPARRAFCMKSNASVACVPLPILSRTPWSALSKPAISSRQPAAFISRIVS